MGGGQKAACGVPGPHWVRDSRAHVQQLGEYPERGAEAGPVLLRRLPRIGGPAVECLAY